MVFTGDNSVIAGNFPGTLSPEQVEKAKLKSSQLDKELGLNNSNDPSDDENLQDNEEEFFSDHLVSESAAKHACLNPSIYFSTQSAEFETEKNLEKMEIIKNVEDCVSQYFSEEELSVIAEKNVSVNATIATSPQSPEIEHETSLEKYITYLSTPDGQERTPMAEDSCTDTEIITPAPVLPVHTINIQHNPSAGSTFPVSGLGVVIPPEVAATMAKGNCSIVLEPVQPSVQGGAVTYAIKTIPLNNLDSELENNDHSATDGGSEGERGQDSDTESRQPQSSSEQQTRKPRGLRVGSCHKGGKLKKYSMWLRIGLTSDIRLGNMTPKEACTKWDCPRTRVKEWLAEYDQGMYSNLPSMYTQDELKNMFRVKGGGRKLKDAVLEEKLITYYNQLKEELYPICTELLAYECLAHDDKFLGGASSPQFTKRISDFLRHWRTRNKKKLRKPTSTGQKLPEGYTGKWEACSYYFYLETKGVPPENVYHGDETKALYEDIPNKVIADEGAKSVPCRTSGQEKEGLTAFLVQNTYGKKLPLFPIFRGDTTANRPGFHTKKSNSSIRQRFQEIINRKVVLRVKGWKKLQFWVNDTAYMDEECFLTWGRTVWKYREDTSGENQPLSVLLLDDLRSHKTQKLMDEFKRLYNTKIIILPGGLTPKAQIMDTHNNRPFKCKVRSKLVKLRSQKYNAAKAEAAKNPLHKGRVGIPKISRGEIVQIMLEAWDEVDPQLGANAWEVVKLMPYELAQVRGWTPKQAFEDIRHLDWPWQMNSDIKPEDAGSDIDAIEWENVSAKHYDGMMTPAEVRALNEAREKQEADESARDTITIATADVESTQETDPAFNDALPQTPPPPPKKARTSPKSRQPAPIFKFALPPKLPCTMENCDDPENPTSSRCQSCSVPGHGNCLQDRLLCTTCYNARMQQQKEDSKKKRSATQAASTRTKAPSKKPRMCTGLSKAGNQVIPQQHRKPNPTNLHRKRGRMLLCLLAYQQPQSVLLQEEPQARETHWCEQRSAWCRKQ